MSIYFGVNFIIFKIKIIFKEMAKNVTPNKYVEPSQTFHVPLRIRKMKKMRKRCGFPSDKRKETLFVPTSNKNYKR